MVLHYDALVSRNLVGNYEAPKNRDSLRLESQFGVADQMIFMKNLGCKEFLDFYTHLSSDFATYILTAQKNSRDNCLIGRVEGRLDFRSKPISSFDTSLEDLVSSGKIERITPNEWNSGLKEEIAKELSLPLKQVSVNYRLE